MFSASNRIVKCFYQYQFCMYRQIPQQQEKMAEPPESATQRQNPLPEREGVMTRNGIANHGDCE